MRRAFGPYKLLRLVFDTAALRPQFENTPQRIVDRKLRFGSAAVSKGPAAECGKCEELSDHISCCGWSSTQPRSVRNLKTRPNGLLIANPDLGARLCPKDQPQSVENAKSLRTTLAAAAGLRHSRAPSAIYLKTRPDGLLIANPDLGARLCPKDQPQSVENAKSLRTT